MEIHRSFYSGPGTDLKGKALAGVMPLKNPYTDKYVSQDLAAY